jgi:sugar phosphate isomerase/epimerase
MVFPNPLAATLGDAPQLAAAGGAGLVARPEAFVDDSFGLTASPDDIVAVQGAGLALVGILAAKPLVQGNDASDGTAHVTSCLDLADALRDYAPAGAIPIVVVDLGPYESGQKDAAYGAAVEALKGLGACAEERQVVLAVRPDRATPVDRARAATRMLADVGSSYVQIAFDAAGTVGDKDTLDDAVGRLKDNIVVAFARDVKFGEDGTPEYLPPGRGVLNYQTYVAMLAEAPGCDYLVVGELASAEATKVALAMVAGFVK